MDRFAWIRVRNSGAAGFCILIALWVAWQGRVFNDEYMGLLTPVMCGLAALTLSFTGYRMVLREEE